ncbi:MAG: GNAT family N-acetyltransferase [Clostridia bacterium]|nr:GNAT family N-acetyltransferase [Clostridia bacterium]
MTSRGTRSVRTASEEDLPRLREIFASARTRMAEEGNAGQWPEGGPPEEKIRADIRAGNCYVVTENGAVIGVFSLIPGDDPTYAVIKDGEWPDDGPYETIHRIAAAYRGAGLFSDVLEFCRGRTEAVRIDTHENNRTMRAVLEKHGFRACGTIFLANGEPRIAYHKRFRDGESGGPELE